MEPRNESSEIVFSIVIPTFNRSDQAGACLGALARLNYAVDAFEVILVDDGGASDLATVALQFRDRLRVRVVRQANGGPASARNRGAACASGRFLVFTDDDCEPTPDWLHFLEEKLRRFPEHIIGGRVVNAAPDDLFATASQSVLDSLYAHYNHDGRTARFFASNNLAVPAHLFGQIGGFHTRFRLAAGEDREFCDRWLRHGYGMAYAPDAVVWHRQATGPSAYWSQHFRYGRGAFLLRRVAREAGRSIGFEGLTLYREILHRPLRGSLNWKGFSRACTVAVSQLAVALGYFFEMTTRGRLLLRYARRG